MEFIILTYERSRGRLRIFCGKTKKRRKPTFLSQRRYLYFSRSYSILKTRCAHSVHERTPRVLFACNLTGALTGHKKTCAKTCSTRALKYDTPSSGEAHALAGLRTWLRSRIDMIANIFMQKNRSETILVSLKNRNSCDASNERRDVTVRLDRDLQISF